MMTEAERIEMALQIAQEFGQEEGAHHKAWVIDQMVRALTACPMVPKTGIDVRGNEYTYAARGESEEYRRFIAAHNNNDDEYDDVGEWDEGIAP